MPEGVNTSAREGLKQIADRRCSKPMMALGQAHEAAPERVDDVLRQLMHAESAMHVEAIDRRLGIAA